MGALSVTFVMSLSSVLPGSQHLSIPACPTPAASCTQGPPKPGLVAILFLLPLLPTPWGGLLKFVGFGVLSSPQIKPKSLSQDQGSHSAVPTRGKGPPMGHGHIPTESPPSLGKISETTGLCPVLIPSAARANSSKKQQFL